MTGISEHIRPILVVLAFSLVIFINLFAQTPQPSPSPSPEPSPSTSPSPSPMRVPSPTPLPGAQNFHQWGSVTVFNGLPSDSVRAIAQTEDGVMWFGTDSGLSRFDGRRVQTIPLGGPETDRILSLALEGSDILWVGTDSGAYVLMRGEFKPVRGTEGIGITALTVRSGTGYLGTDTGLVLRIRPGGSEASPMFSEPLTGEDGVPLSIGCLVHSKDRLLACSTGKGVVEIVGNKAIEFATSPRTLFVRSLTVANDGQVWFGANAARGASGVYATGPDSKIARIPAPTADVFALEANYEGVWAGTERYGLFQFVGSKLKKNFTFENTSGGLRSNMILTMFTDREGVLWIGTNRGVSRFDTNGASQETVSDIPNSNFIRSLYQTADGRLYAGSNRGLFIKSKETWEQLAAYGNGPVYAIAEDKTGKLIAGRYGGGDAWGFADFRGAKYAAVSGVGLVQIKPNGDTIVHPEPLISSAFGTSQKVYIGTKGNGLFSYDGQAVKLEASRETSRSGTIWKMNLAQDGALWIAGQHGVFRYREGQAEKIIDAEDVRDLLVDGDEVWAPTTTRGLLHARNDPQFGWIVSAFGFEQGLPSEKAFAIVPSDKGLLIATNRGVVTYKPGTVEPKLIATRLLSQRVHDVRELASRIELEYPQNSLLVEVAGQSSRTFPEEFLYGFTLTNGGIVDRRVSNDAQYAPEDLAPGEYEIEAIAFNRDLIASAPLTIRFSVAKAPFPWTATALGVLLLMALVGLVWAVIEHRRIAERNRELAAARLDLANEAERERRRIARDLHDQTLADLRNLMIKSDKLTPGNPEFRGEIEAVSTEIRRICEDLSPSVLENVGLVAALEFLLDHTVENRKFEADEGVEDRIVFPLTVQLQIYRIAQEVLTNITRHSDADLVEMNVTASADGEFDLKIRDNGSAFQPNGSHKGRGIANIRSRANLVNGKVAWRESRDGGNVFSLHVDAKDGRLPE